MSSDKKDLTRIEDLGEFIHELNSEDEDFLPDLPTSEEDDEVPAFESESSFGSENSESGSFESESFESNSFESGPFESDNSFESNDSFESSSFDEGGSFESTSFESDSFESSSLDSTEESSGGLEFGTTEEFPENNFESSTSDFTAGFDTTEESAPQDEVSVETKPEEEPSWNTDIPLTEEVTKEPEPVMETPIPVMERTQEYKAPETFEDLKKFSESSSFSGMATEGNPSFSVLLKNVRFIEDVNDIVTLLKELNLLVDSEEQTKSRLMRGMLLVPRISEFAAIFLAHKLRRFDIDIQVGLSDEIHPPKHQEVPETGIVSKHNLYQNQGHYFHFDDPKLDISQIIVSATSNLEGYQVVKYMGVASEHKMLEGHVVEDEHSSEIPSHYQELAQKLKAHALKANSNAVVGLNYQLTPIPSEFGIGGHKYRLTCTGNLVWVNKL